MVLRSTHNLCFKQKKEKYQGFYFNHFQILEVKISINLNMRVFVMATCITLPAEECVLKYFWPTGTRNYPKTIMSFVFLLIVMDPGLLQIQSAKEN